MPNAWENTEMKARNKQLSSVGKWRFVHVGGGAGSVGFQCFPKSSSGCLSPPVPLLLKTMVLASKAWPTVASRRTWLLAWCPTAELRRAEVYTCRARPARATPAIGAECGRRELRPLLLVYLQAPSMQLVDLSGNQHWSLYSGVVKSANKAPTD